ncbi:hypothetical protein B9Z55_028204 [Caenorhabditis nigoni]|uniref:Mos1 transposase HTH domain-containing protein n=1 Tax=Caenorhabditis nigoni TaxID=1611254 RepID=A0A2G5SC80_9PELO|nr:hypothetical protein B9Z55_028204 [Caenorhabditis nigoni]
MFVPTAIHIRHVLIYLFLSHTTMKDSETFLKNVYNTHAPHYNTIRNWFHRFEKDDFSLDEKDRSGRPRELDLDKLKHALQSDPFQSSRELAVTFGVHHSTVVPLPGAQPPGFRLLYLTLELLTSEFPTFRVPSKYLTFQILDYSHRSPHLFDAYL